MAAKINDSKMYSITPKLFQLQASNNSKKYNNNNNNNNSKSNNNGKLYIQIVIKKT
jgi:hypothetical protein